MRYTRKFVVLLLLHYNDVIMSAMASQITSLTIVYSTFYSGVDQTKRQNSASLAFVSGIHRWPVNFPPKGPVTRTTFPFDDVIMLSVTGLISSPLRTVFLPQCQWSNPEKYGLTRSVLKHVTNVSPIHICWSHFVMHEKFNKRNFVT